MRYVVTTCQHCWKKTRRPYKKRKQKFCNLECAYAIRKQPIKQCQECGGIIEGSGKKYCSTGCASKAYSRTYRHDDAARKKMTGSRARRCLPVIRVCLQCGEEFVTYGKRQGRHKYCSVDCRREMMLTNNVMCRPDVAASMSATRSKFLENPKERDKIGARTSQAWKDGKYDGVGVGQCKWYHYKALDGRICKVQGVWELALVEWLDENGFTFTVHRGRFDYELDGKAHWYMPDFWVDEWDAFVDVKCRHFYKPEKFQAIRRDNPDKQFWILLKRILVE